MVSALKLRTIEQKAGLVRSTMGRAHWTARLLFFPEVG